MDYILMHKDIPVLEMEINEGGGNIVSVNEIITPTHIPVCVSYLDNKIDLEMLNKWWMGRSIPASRSGLRDALEFLGISSPKSLLTKCYGLSLSDQYWVCPVGANLKWKNINFFENEFSEDVGKVLFGEPPLSGEISLLSPDNTSDGVLKKKWKIIDGKRCLIKGGSGLAKQQPYNEVLASKIMERLDIPHTPYTLLFTDKQPYSVCEDFITASTELVPAIHIMLSKNRDENISYYQHYINCCQEYGITDITNSLDYMLTVDYLISNEDRHLNNFGVIRNADTLEWIGSAPIFDCGSSLWYDLPVAYIFPASVQPSKPFCKDHQEQIKLVKSFEWLDFALLKDIENDFREILKNSPFVDKMRTDTLCDGLNKRIEMLQDYILTNKIKVYQSKNKKL